MAIGTLAAIIQKVRFLTGTANNFQLTDAQIKDFINSFYLYDFPARFRSLKLKDVYTFETIRGINTYPFDSERYTTIENPCYCMKRQMKLFTNQSNFFGTYYNWQNQQNIDFGNGTAGPYSGIATSLPVVRSVNNDPNNINYPASRVQNMLITANTATGTVNVTDDGLGNLYQVDNSGAFVANIGTVDYQTGVFSFTYVNAVTIPAVSPLPQGGSNPIQLQYNAVVLSIPISILFIQNQFTLWPIPDRGYSVELTAYRQPTQALENAVGDTGTPEQIEWWETIAFGAAKKVYENRLDPDGVTLMDKGLAERYALNEIRTYAQLGSEQIGTIFTDQLQNNYGSNSWGIGNAV